MVVAVLVNRFAPSSRGLVRGSSTGGKQQWKTAENRDQTSNRARHKAKPFKAIALLTSLASDFDVVSDWLFFQETYRYDRNFRETREQGDAPYLIPPVLIWSALIACIFGTIMWLILATDGRVIAPVLRRAGYDKLSIGHMLFLCVLLEDLPQVILTFLIEDYYEAGGNSLSNLAVVNVTASLYDTLIKLAEAYDERHDIVETGDWCKKSLWAHHDIVTCIKSLPLPPSTLQYQLDLSTSDAMAFRFMPSHSEASLAPANLNSTSALSSSSLIRPRLKRENASVLTEALEPIAPMQLPRLRFLTTSLDKTVRLWDTAASIKGHRREQCVRAFRGHKAGVTSLSLLARRSEAAKGQDYHDEEAEHTTFFVTGCQEGEVKLWNLHGDCLQTYPSFGYGVTGIACVKIKSTFVCSYEDGSSRLWEAWSGLCLGLYRGHNKTINCIMSLLDETNFVTGSQDSTIKLWDTTPSMHALLSWKEELVESTTQPLSDQVVCERSFSYHSPVVCLACLETSTAFVAGYANGVARLWAVETGHCLRSFPGHGGPVTSIEAIDAVTFLTGSADYSIRAWDAVSGICLRTYVDHKGPVSSISMSDDEHTFLTASADRTVKIWVLTAVPRKNPEEQLDSILDDVSDGLCRGFDPE